MGAPIGSIHLVRSQFHYGWNRDHQPLVSVASGAEITLETLDASGGQLSPGSSAAEIATLDFNLVNPVTGPIFVEGARPGDVLQVELLHIEPGGWGWTGLIPGFGLLADQFPDPWFYGW